MTAAAAVEPTELEELLKAQVEALNIDSRRRGGKILCRGASRC